MKRKISFGVVLLFLLLWSVSQFAGAGRASAQGGAGTQPAAPPSQAAPEAQATGTPANTVNEPPVRYSLDCAGCHGPGKTLPYLAGERFHKDAHAAWEKGHHARALRDGGKSASCLDCHATSGDISTMLPKSDPRSTVNRANVAATCGRCHGDAGTMRGSGIGSRLFISYQESVHARAVARGNPNAAVCTDCHNSHDVRPGSDPQSPIFKFNVPQTCGQCHGNVTAEFAESVHGTSIGRGNSQSPVCTDCHGIHDIKSRQLAKDMLRTNSCAKCHEGVRLSREFGLASDRVSSFEDSYHGMAKRLGSDVVADCASCHGVHNILPSSNPNSMIAPANLTQTCGQCHPGAGQKFAVGKVHLNVPYSQDAGSVGVRWVRWVYLGIIFVTIGGMAAHNLLVWGRKAAAKRRRRDRTVVRLTRSQRVQHWLLLTSFIALVFSGFALVYPDSWLAYIGFSSESFRRTVHRVAAVVMIVAGVYHVFYLLVTDEGRKWLRDMLPRAKDVRDVIQFFGHYLGFKVARPKFERFGYAEKAEYWAVVWGTVVMGLTGLMIWFKVGLFGWLPRWWVDIAIAVHFYEAVLATLAIVVWHFYHVIFDPDVYPINWAFYDGRMPEEQYRHEHELDYERMRRAEREEAEREEAEREEARRAGADGQGKELGGGPEPSPSQGD